MRTFSLSGKAMKAEPLKSAGIILFLAGRFIFAAVFLYGFWHKYNRGWLWTDKMHQYFTQRLSELTPGSFQAFYLEQFAMPLALPIAWIVTIGELIIGVCLVLGLGVRVNAAFALFLVLNFAAGGYYNLTLPPFMIYSILMMIFPSGHWFGLDRTLHEKYPESIWFR